MTRLVVVDGTGALPGAVRQALRAAGCGLLDELDGATGVGAERVLMSAEVVLVVGNADSAATVTFVEEVADRVGSAMCVVLIDDEATGEWVDLVFAAGANAVLVTAVEPSTLATLLREIVRGTIVCPSRRPQLPAADDARQLTARELEILGLVARGMTNGQIARDLWLAEDTVKFHLSNVYRKLDVANRTEASHYAHLHRIVELEDYTPTRPPVAA